MNKIKHHPKIQHYIPKGILRAFASGKKSNRIAFIDKFMNKKAITTNLKNVAGINKFYDYKNGNSSLEVGFFGPIDDKTSQVIKELLSPNINKKIDKNKIEILAKFVASQICRVPYKMESLISIQNAFKEQISSSYPTFDGNINDYFLTSIIHNTEAYTKVLLKKSMIIYTSENSEFIIGDNPVILLDCGNPVVEVSKYTSVIDAGVFMIPISPKEILIFYDREKKKNLTGHIANNNSWQFFEAHNYVFGLNEHTLKDELKIYHENSYRYISHNKPSFIKEHQLSERDPVTIGAFEFVFEGQAKEELLRMVSEKL